MGKRQRKFKRPVIGDIVEIPLPGKRLAYAQYLSRYTKPPVWGELIRVLPPILRNRPDDFSDLVRQREKFHVFFPVGAAVNRGMVRLVVNEEIPEAFSKFPVFKACNTNFETGKKTWWLWDGEKSWRVGELSPEHYDYPIQQIVSFGALVDLIDRGWLPRDEV